MDQLFAVKLDNGSTLEVRAPEELALKPHDNCVFRRDFYTDMGEVVRRIEKPSSGGNPADLPAVQKIAGNGELATANENCARERSAMRTARQLVENLGLNMKLLNAHYSLDGKLVTIQFSADGRVDFRELVKELSRALCTRIELRQIGVRDETGIYGGIAVCGQQLCCSRFLREFNSINVKMAKEQDLSLTPATISGACGRLKCCLKYEHEGYRELEKGMPRRGEWCDTPAGRGRVSDRNLLTQRVSVSLENGSVTQFAREEITVLPPPPRPQPGSGPGRRTADSKEPREKRDSREQRRPNETREPREKREGGRRERRGTPRNPESAGEPEGRREQTTAPAQKPPEA